MTVIPIYKYCKYNDYMVFYFKYHIHSIKHDSIKSNWIPAASFKHSIASDKHRIRK